jgi:hypothetical protein
MSVHRKTMQGRIDAFNNQSSLTEELRQLLLHVDGKTPFHRLQAYLGRHVCSSENINELINRGLVRAVTAATDEPLDFDAQSLSSDISYRSTVPAPLRMLLNSKLGALHSPIPNLPKQSTNVLEEAKDLMSDFVLMNLPEHAYGALKEIEQITSIKILASSILAYELLVQPTGTTGKRHIQRLKQMTASVS